MAQAHRNPLLCVSARLHELTVIVRKHKDGPSENRGMASQEASPSPGASSRVSRTHGRTCLCSSQRKSPVTSGVFTWPVKGRDNTLQGWRAVPAL